jgi:hypothetical protein
MSTRWTPPIALSPREQRLCDKLQKHRRFFRFLRLHRHELFADGFEEQLLALYSEMPRGTPPKPPAMLATVVLLQAYTRASDDDAVQLAETDVRWQMVLDCLGAEDAPFKRTTLVDYRARLVRAGFYAALVRRTADLARRSGDFDPKAVAALRVAVDSLPLEGAGRVEDTLNLLARALRLLAAAVAAAVLLTPEEVYAAAGLRILAASSPKAGLDRDWDAPGATDAALTDLMQEVERLRCWMHTAQPATLQQRRVHDAHAQLARVIAQDTEPCASGGHRVRQETTPDRQLSLFDPAMRHGRKSKTGRIDGYKVYLATDLDTDVTLAVGALAANTPEAHGADKLEPHVTADHAVATLYVDRAFLASGWVERQAARGPDAVVCRAPAPPADRTRYGKHDFAIDLAHGEVTCPAGQRTVITVGAEGAYASFGAAQCRPCPQRAACLAPTQPPRRRVAILPQEALLQRARRATATPEGRARLRERAGIEHVNAHHARRYGHQARYCGIPKNDFDAARIAAVNNLLVMDRRLRASGVEEQIAA